MSSDRVFAIYALSLVTAVGGLLTATVVSGMASAPSLAFVVEHLTMGLVIRGSYKSFGGANYIHDFLEFAGMIGSDESSEPAGAHPSAA